MKNQHSNNGTSKSNIRPLVVDHLTMTLTIKVASSREEKLKAFDFTNYAFAQSPSEYENKFEELQKYRKTTSVLLAYEGETLVSTAQVVHMKQNVRNKVLSMGGVAGVATMPEFRRRGHVKKLIRQTIEFMRERGEVVSTLYPFRESFYQRMGYSNFPHTYKAKFSPSAIQLEPPEGTVSRHHIKDVFDEYWKYLQRYVSQTHSAASFDRTKGSEILDRPVWVAVARDSSGEIQGMMTYQITGFEGEMNVRSMYYSNSLGKYLLLHWIGKHVDQVTTVNIPVAAGDELALWLPDLKSIKTSRPWVPSPMGRIIDVEGLEGISVGEGSISLRIEDEFAPWNNKTYTFTSVEGKLSISEGGEGPALKINALSALIYGTHNPHDFEYHGWGKLTTEQVFTALKLFPRKMCLLNENF